MPDPITESSPSSVGATPAQTNIGVVGSSETPVWTSSRDRPMTQDQFHSLYQLLQNLKVGTEGEQTPMDTAAANCAGISHPPLSKSPKSFISVSLSSISWILDSGASEHMTSDINLLFNITMLPKPVYVNLPNSTRALVLQSGSVHLLPSLTLKNVMFAPSFNYNLLSVYRLCFQFNSILIFSVFGAILQDPSMKRPLVLGKVNRGLYLLESSKPSHLKTPAAISSLGNFPSTSVCNQSAHAQVSNSVLFLDITSVPTSISPSPHSLLQDPSVPLPDSPSIIPSPSTVSIPTSDTLPVRKSTRLHHPPS
ncbi:hypothetical protein H5410_016820 [Solanum commersonii]|uniref:Retrovirus-related Pol polyprotein from transposon TNT 1-94-like beta-barrel domain-containing protein n=1 Tax=Solanum commersonii TaxID=4109 RepID=A0A9J5ZYH9_SOLCO|nr:hypothetical protein H5410_016820 [Solanum commersonii]